MTATQPMESPTQERRSLALSGAQVLGAMAEQGFSPASFSVIPGGNFVGATVFPAEINSDPATASLIAVQMQMTTPTVTPTSLTTADPEMQQRSYLLAVLRKFAQNDPELRRDPLFWAALSSAEKGQGLSLRQQQILGRAWAKRSRRFAATRRSARENRAFAGAMAAPVAFRHNTYLTTMPAPSVATYGRIVTLGEPFEEALFNKLMPPSPQPSEVGTEGHPLDHHHEPHHAHQHRARLKKSLDAKPSPRRTMKAEDGTAMTANFASRPKFNPKLTPSFSDTDSGDEG